MREEPEAGRFLRSDINVFQREAWEQFDRLVAEVDLRAYPTVGNRLLVLFTIVTIAIYQSLRSAGIEKSYAIELLADVGWKIYVFFLPIPKRIARVVTGNTQGQMDLIWRMLLFFPFRAPGRPGFEVSAWREEGRLFTHWTYCAVFHYVRQYLESHPDEGELEAFFRSWCWYDWAFAYAIAEGSGSQGITRVRVACPAETRCATCAGRIARQPNTAASGAQHDCAGRP